MILSVLPDHMITRPWFDDRTSSMLTLVDRVPTAERSTIVECLAWSLLDRFDELRRGAYDADFLAWVDRTCEAHAGTPAVAALLTSFPSQMRRAGRGPLTLEERGILRRLEPLMRRLAEKPRRVAQIPMAATIDTTDAALNTMLVQLERSDPLSAEHSRAVSAWCVRIARKLGLSAEEETYVARCGLIHDVGKITTPTDILHAPRQLSEDEWTIMRDHASAGERITRSDPHLELFSPSVRSHHERLDGKGYPDRLSADRIELATRIVTVADCFNAMIGRRPYRLPMSPVLAIEQLRKHTGVQFDAEVARAMIDAIS